MNENRMMGQVTAIFSVFMVIFYIGVGSYFIFFFKYTYLDKAVRVIMGSTFIFYGLYRAYRTYITIVEVFFRNKNDSD
jgi:hypothetical protein